jgi:hypothetical protein
MDWSEDVKRLFGGGALSGQVSQVLVSEEAHQQIEACRAARNQQKIIGVATGGAAVAYAALAVRDWRRREQTSL